MGEAVAVIVTQYGWKRVALLTQQSVVCDYGGEAIQKRLKVDDMFQNIKSFAFLLTPNNRKLCFHFLINNSI